MTQTERDKKIEQAQALVDFFKEKLKKIGIEEVVVSLLLKEEDTTLLQTSCSLYHAENTMAALFRKLPGDSVKDVLRNELGRLLAESVAERINKEGE